MKSHWLVIAQGAGFYGMSAFTCAVEEERIKSALGQFNLVPAQLSPKLTGRPAFTCLVPIPNPQCRENTDGVEVTIRQTAAWFRQDGDPTAIQINRCRVLHDTGSSEDEIAALEIVRDALGLPDDTEPQMSNNARLNFDQLNSIDGVQYEGLCDALRASRAIFNAGSLIVRVGDTVREIHWAGDELVIDEI